MVDTTLFLVVVFFVAWTLFFVMITPTERFEERLWYRPTRYERPTRYSSYDLRGDVPLPADQERAAMFHQSELIEKTYT